MWWLLCLQWPSGLVSQMSLAHACVSNTNLWELVFIYIANIENTDRVKGKQLQSYIISLLELHVKHLFMQRFGFLWEDWRKLDNFTMLETFGIGTRSCILLMNLITATLICKCQINHPNKCCYRHQCGKWLLKWRGNERDEALVQPFKCSPWLISS